MGEGKAAGFWVLLYPPKSAHTEKGKGYPVAPTPQISERRISKTRNINNCGV